MFTRSREHEARTKTKISDEAVFAVQDVTFRLDVVGPGNGGGMADDGLLKGLRQDGKKDADDAEGGSELDPALLAALSRSGSLWGMVGGLLFLRAVSSV